MWLGFGPARSVVGERGTRSVNEFAVHVQCLLRVFDSAELVLASGDLTSDRFDRRAARLRTALADESHVVTSVEVTTWGDLTIGLTGGLRIEVVVDSSRQEEHWRFFRPYRDEDHLVVFD